jgi:hypothetical protein
VIEQLRAAVSADDMDTFKKLLSAQTQIPELSEAMREALAHDHAGAVPSCCAAIWS